MSDSTILAIASLSMTAVGTEPAPIKIEKVKYSIYGNCYKLSNGTVDLLVTTDLGPRVIYYGFTGEENILAELGPECMVKTELGEWHHWGGHRLWHAPEVLPRSYAPDNDPIEAEMIGKSTIRVAPALETATNIKKEMYISLDREGTGVTITHTLKNKGPWPIELAPWALTIMNGGGVTIFPQEPFLSHDKKLLPVRSMSLWGFTDMSDSRWTFGKKYIQLRTDEKLTDPQKIGVANKQEWAAYLREGTLFVKRFHYVDGANYPDYGCNFETYTEGKFMEVETLGPLTKLDPNDTATHVEHWHLFRGVDAGDDEETLDKAITPLVASTVLK